VYYNYNQPYPTTGYSQPYPSTTGYSQPTIYNLPGKTVASQEEIRPNDISMDGRISFFPMNDYSCIFAKAWNSDGTISTVKFIPQAQETPVVKTDDKYDSIIERLDRIEASISHRKPHVKKEAPANA
jgi:hypothetical protein